MLSLNYLKINHEYLAATDSQKLKFYALPQVHHIFLWTENYMATLIIQKWDSCLDWTQEETDEDNSNITRYWYEGTLLPYFHFHLQITVLSKGTQDVIPAQFFTATSSCTYNTLHWKQLQKKSRTSIPNVSV